MQPVQSAKEKKHMDRISPSTLAKRRKEGMAKLAEVYGRKLMKWEIPTLIELEGDLCRKALLISVRDLLTPVRSAEVAARQEAEFEERIAGVLKSREIADEWGL